jgi:predicted  nucleic acid-binding Zn-ribbon protein
LLSAYFNDDLIDELKRWKKSRNDLMHELADSTKTILELDKETYLLSENSKSLVNSTCNASRLLKKNREKA